MGATDHPEENYPTQIAIEKSPLDSDVIARPKRAETIDIRPASASASTMGVLSSIVSIGFKHFSDFAWFNFCLITDFGCFSCTLAKVMFCITLGAHITA
jgi:hypothetical protein